MHVLPDRPRSAVSRRRCQRISSTLARRPREDGAFVGDHERAFDQNWVFDHRVEDLGFGCIGEPEFLELRFALANGLGWARGLRRRGVFPARIG